MAETAKQVPSPAAAIPPPAEPAPAAPKVTKREGKFMKVMGKLMTSTAWMAFGVGFIFLGILFHIKDIIPTQLKPAATQLFPHLPYLLVGLGFLCIGQLRSGIRNDYSAEYKKNRQFSHAWKIPLIIAEVLIYQAIGIYGILVGVGKVPPIKNLMGLVLLFLLFTLYLLWYAIAYMKNRFPSFAAFRIAAFLGLVPALLSLCFWVSQLIFLSLVFAILALIATLVSLNQTSTPDQAQRLNWMRNLCVLGTVCLLLIVGLNASSSGKPHVQLAGLGLASKDPMGTVGVIAYSPENWKELNNPKTATYQRLAFSLKTSDGWFLQIMDAKADEALPMGKDLPKESITRFKVPAGEESFHPYFVDGGHSILLDAVKGGERGLWKVDAATGSVVILRRGGVQPFGDGVPWSDKTKQFLYVTGDDSGYRLNAYPAGKAKKPLFTSTSPILSPSWTMSAEDIAYADGVHGTFNLLDLATGKSSLFFSGEEMAEKQKMSGLKVTEVLPAPDGFRYLYLTEDGNTSSLWSVLADGTKREAIYESRGQLRDIAWTPDGQKVIFEEQPKRSVFFNLFYPYGFLTQSTRIRILDANLNTVENLILPQISHRAPALSPDGVKVAFVADQGLWFRQGKQGIWVAHLR